MVRLPTRNRERVIRRHVDEHLRFKVLAAKAGIRLRTAYKWLAQYRSGGHTSLADRRSVRRTQRRTLAATADCRGPPAPALHPQ